MLIVEHIIVWYLVYEIQNILKIFNEFVILLPVNLKQKIIRPTLVLYFYNVMLCIARTVLLRHIRPSVTHRYSVETA